MVEQSAGVHKSLLASSDTPRHSCSSSSGSSTGRERLDVHADGSVPSAARAILRLGNNSRGERRNAGDDTSSRRSTFATISREEDERNHHERPTLMDEMISAAAAARSENAAADRQRHKESIKKKQFASGLKKGFLSSNAPPASTTTKKKPTPTAELKANGTCTSSTSSPDHASGRECRVPLVNGRPSSSGGRGLEFDVSAPSGDCQGSLVLPEVQEAMRQSQTPLAGVRSQSSQEWLTPDLLDKISERPHLAEMLTDPRFAEAMKIMSTRPQEALGKFASNPEARERFTELMALLANHFTGIGKAADERKKAEEEERRRMANGSLAQDALRRARQGSGLGASPPTPEETAGVDKVLGQPQLRELLMDPDLQKVLQECAEPSALARYIRHPEYGPKLRCMAEAGLISFRP